MPKKILYIEDEVPIAEAVATHLRKEGFDVTYKINGHNILDYIHENPVDLVVLDIMLPEINGFEILALLRKEFPHLPALFTSALSEVDNRIKGLDLGANDYITKPFDLVELTARIQVILKRCVNKKSLFNFKDLQLDKDNPAAHRNGVTVSLTQKEYLLLKLLLENQGKVVSRNIIIDTVWDMNYDKFNNTVDVHIRKLRKKIDEPFDEGYIKTIKGFGYAIK